MKKQFAIFLSATIILFSFSCSKSSNDDNNNNNNNTNTVSISGFAFNSSDLHVTTGTTVTWTNNDDVAHTVTADDATFTSGNLNKGDTYSHTFATAGTVHYHCNIHPMMTAEVIVQ